MVDDKTQAISVRLTGSNYSYWSHVMKNFVVGKGMWDTQMVLHDHLPTQKRMGMQLQKWTVENAQILTWFHNSVEPSIGMNFSKYDTSGMGLSESYVS